MKNLSALLIAISLCFAACAPDAPAPGPTPVPSEVPSGTPTPSPSVEPSQSPTPPSPTPSASPTAGPRKVLLWDGAHSWAPEVRDLKARLDAMKISYVEISSLEGVDYSLFSGIIMGGGKARSRLDTIPQVEEDRLREAIKSGLSYLGHCAGAFMAGCYGSWGLCLSPVAYDYPTFGAILTMSQHQMLKEGGVRHILFYGGAELDGHGEVLATYRNGQASITQFRYGQGLVILTGGHPEVSQVTIRNLGLMDPDGDDAVVEEKLLRAVRDNQEVQ